MHRRQNLVPHVQLVKYLPIGLPGLGYATELWYTCFSKWCHH